MSHRYVTLALLLALITVGLLAGAARAQVAPATVFTYQGSLEDDGEPADGAYDFQFRLYGAPGEGTPIGSALSRDDVVVEDGIFTVALDFGPVFDGGPRFLELSVRPGASTAAYTTLAPRQELTAAPLALHSAASASTGALRGRAVSETAPVEGQVLRWDGSAWVPATVEGAGYTAGPGLNLVGSRFEVRFGGDGSSTAAARADHTHFGQNWIGDVGYTSFWVENRSTAAGAAGVVGRSVNSDGVYASSSSSFGVRAVSNAGIAVGAYGGTRGLEATGSEFGVLAESAGHGALFRSTNAGRAVEAQSNGSGTAVIAFNENDTGYAGWFQGRLHVQGRLSKSSGSFTIDHPLDPANRLLSHSFVESPDMLNIYNGTVTLDADGAAVVELPSYFDALNIEPRYQLTPIGAAAPNLHIAAEVRDGRFAIAGGTPGLKVSWQVTGVRNDPYARDNRIAVEEDKPAAMRGTYLYPAAGPATNADGSALVAPFTPSAADRTQPAPEPAAPPAPTDAQP